MFSIGRLFAKSPFAPLQTHMEKVSRCVEVLVELLQAFQDGDYETAEALAPKVSKLEHEADLTKNDIRNHLPTSLFLPVDRGNILEVLAIQDSIADKAEDIGIVLTFKKVPMLDELREDFSEFLQKNIQTFEGAKRIIEELNELLESSFGGAEAEKVKAMVDEVAYNEHEVDLIQRKLLRVLFKSEDKMTYGTFHLWLKIVEQTSAISDLSEKLANRVRMMLELK